MQPKTKCRLFLNLCFYCATVEPRFNEPLCNEVLGITNDIFQPSNSKCMEKNLDITNPRYSEPISPVLWHFVNANKAILGTIPSIQQLTEGLFFCGYSSFLTTHKASSY